MSTETISYGTTLKEAYSLLHKGSLVLSRMEANGIRIDLEYLDKTIQKLDKDVLSLQKELKSDEIYKVWFNKYGNSTDVNSTKQMRDVFYNVLKFPVTSVTEKTKIPKIDDTALTKIDKPFTRNFLKIKKYTNLKTRLVSLKGLTVNGYFHPIFNLHTASTYRSSSGGSEGADWNIQNTPTRDEELGKLIRQCFVPDNDCVLIENDFKTLEVCIGACYHRDPLLIEYIKDPTKDMHRDSAAKIYKLPLKESAAKKIRYYGKNAFVFPEFYGSVYFQCAPHLWEATDKLKLSDGTSLKDHLKSKGIKSLGDCEPNANLVDGTFVHHLKQFEDEFWGKKFRVYAQWKKNWFQQYLKTGGFQMLTGFYVEGIYKRNEVVNYPIQGGAFHCLLWTITRLQEILEARGMKAKLIAQIHDSVLANVPKSEVQEYLKIVNHIVSVELPKEWKWICVPLKIEAEISARSWFHKKPWIEENGVWGPEKKSA